jgi:hypothetical protein
LIAAPKKGGEKYERRSFGPLSPEARAEMAEQLHVGSIVWMKGELYPVGHYVVRRRDGWMDPLWRKPRKTLPDKAPLVSYIARA